MIQLKFEIGDFKTEPTQSRFELVRPNVLALHEVDEGLIHHFVSTWGRVVSCKVPVSQILRTSLMQVGNVLIDDFHLRRNVLWCDDLSNLVGNLLWREGGVNFLHIIHHIFFWKIKLRHALIVYRLDQIFLIVVVKKLNGCSESYKVPEFRHIDAVAVGGSEFEVPMKPQQSS